MWLPGLRKSSCGGSGEWSRRAEFRDARKPLGWEHSAWADYWNQFHGGFVAVTLAVATLLTVYSFFLYLYRNRALFSDRAR